MQQSTTLLGRIILKCQKLSGIDNENSKNETKKVAYFKRI